jgi:riboflavin synthase
MFTGLVETLGTVRRIDRTADGCELTVAAAFAAELAVGESVSVNGACLTVVSSDADSFRFQAGPETLLRTNLGELAVGDRVNLERALRVGDRVGGHFVQGHVDAVGRVAERAQQGEYFTVWFSCPAELTELIVPKGSVAIDGISLTPVDVTAGRFSVMLIPHTLGQTTLGFKQPGAAVNLEADMLAKHVRKLLQNTCIDI